MPDRIACFASSRYWKDRGELETVFRELVDALGLPGREARLVVDGAGLGELDGKPDALVAVPMSGAVQKDILRAAEGADSVVLYAGYVKGNAPSRGTERMLENNAAPTLMDCWAVLRKTHPRALLALDRDQLARRLKLLGARRKLAGARLLLIGDTEPWVVSVSRDPEAYRRLGVEVVRVAQEEVAGLYRSATDEEARAVFERYSRSARACVEPTEGDLRNAARMTTALLKALERHRADGLAIACFNLLSLGTTSCVGVSYINGCTDKVAACEGDLDSAVTMLMLRQLTGTGLWMANPGLHPDGTINFSHCTAPVTADGTAGCPFTLRSHHESGIGASLQVELPSPARLTACRVSGLWGSFTVQGATGMAGPPEPCCRTQLYVRFDDMDRYLRTALGCHQVFCFEDVREDFATLASWMGLKPEG